MRDASYPAMATPSHPFVTSPAQVARKFPRGGCKVKGTLTVIRPSDLHSAQPLKHKATRTKPLVRRTLRVGKPTRDKQPVNL